MCLSWPPCLASEDTEFDSSLQRQVSSDSQLYVAVRVTLSGVQSSPCPPDPLRQLQSIQHDFRIGCVSYNKHTLDVLMCTWQKLNQRVWQTLHLQPAVIKVRDCVNMCVLLFVRVEPTDWTATVEVRGGRQCDRPPVNYSNSHQAVPTTHWSHTHILEHTEKHTRKLMGFCFSSR